MTDITLTVEDRHGLTALLQRLVRLDAQALVRFREVSPGQWDVFGQTPFATLAARRVVGHISREGVARARDVLASDKVLPFDASWAGALPPREFTLVDEIPVAVVADLATKGRALARQFSGPMGPPKSLLDQSVLQVSGNGLSADITMREVFTSTSLGLIPPVHNTDVPRHIRVSVCGRWVRMDAPFGTVYRSQGLNLLV